MKFRRQRDSNHSAVVAQLRAKGYAVSDLSASGGGVPDLYVSKGRHGCFVEVKAPGALRPAGRYRAEVRARQTAWADRHPGLVITATSADEVDAAWPAG